MFYKQQKGFTLIELLVVVAIIGILSGIVIVGVGDSIQRARMARSQVFSRAIHSRIGMDLSGWWSFENNALDRSGWGNVGTLHNFPTHPGPRSPWVPGVIGNALRFNDPADGVADDRVTVPPSATLQPPSVTVEGWFKLDDRGDRHILITNWYGYSLEIHADGRPYFRLHGITPMDTLSIQSITWGRWYHIVAIFDDTTKRVTIFINGINARTATVSGSITYGTPPGFVLGWAIRGLIDEVRIYRAAMPTSYIQKRYVQGIKDLASNGGITQEEKQERLAVLRNSGHLAIDLDAALAGNIDFSQYAEYLVLEK